MRENGQRRNITFPLPCKKELTRCRESKVAQRGKHTSYNSEEGLKLEDHIEEQEKREEEEEEEEKKKKKKKKKPK